MSCRINYLELISKLKEEFKKDNIKFTVIERYCQKNGYCIPVEIRKYPRQNGYLNFGNVEYSEETVQNTESDTVIQDIYCNPTSVTEKTIEKPSNNQVVEFNTIDTKEKIEMTKKINYNDFIPQINPVYVPYGNNKQLLKNIVKEQKFFPVYIWGNSGLGKTLMIEQLCAQYKRPFFRAQITRETTNEDLLGNFLLVNGNTQWVDGAILMAYRSGGVLLLDEIDLNSNLMILQIVLENKPILVAQTGELVYPKDGFTVFATGNTNGLGNDSRFVGTSVLNDAFLERFVVIQEQPIPTIDIEEKMINSYCKINNLSLEDDLKLNFLKWIELCRDNFVKENTEIYISSRRVQYILSIYSLMKNFNKAIELGLSRYPSEEAQAFMKFWKAIYAGNIDTTLNSNDIEQEDFDSAMGNGMVNAINNNFKKI